jgi:hypothetical protein
VDVGSSLRQCEILSDLIQVHLDVACIGSGAEVALRRKHPFAIVLSQDCDLTQDGRARIGTTNTDKMIPSVLFCEVTTANELKSTLDQRRWDAIKINDNKRYQFLQKIEPHEDALGEGLPELGIDFKRFFTIPTDEVYRRIELKEAKRRCVLCSPYLEHLSTRFAYFLSRVALDPDHVSE